MNGTRRIIYITLGTFFLILGAIGIFVPLLPTTPFWLLTCWFYVRSSEKLYNRVMSNRYFGPHIKGFVEDYHDRYHVAIYDHYFPFASRLLVGESFVRAYQYRGLMAYPLLSY